MGESGGAPLIEAFSEVESVEATDNKTVTIKLANPSAEFLAYLTAPIIPESYDKQAEFPIGSGPFNFVSRTPLENYVVERFDDYWGEKAYLQKVTFKIIASADTLVTQLNAGALDMVNHLTSAQVSGLSKDYNVLEGTMNLVQALYLNNEKAPLNDVNVRRALCYALDRQPIMDILADGRGTALGSGIYPAFTKYFAAELAGAYKRDIETAKRLLADAGYPNGFNLTITVPEPYTPHVDTAQVLVEQFKEIGVNVTLNPIEWETWLSDVYVGRNFEATVIGFDAKALTARAMLERWQTNEGGNKINFSDAEYDTTVLKAMAETDDAAQTALYKRCQEILSEQAASVFIQDLCDLVALNKKFTGYEFYPLYAMDMAKVKPAG
jgi:peptide/nickel transport system substrate-binding protein